MSETQTIFERAAQRLKIIKRGTIPFEKAAQIDPRLKPFSLTPISPFQSAEGFRWCDPKLDPLRVGDTVWTSPSGNAVCLIDASSPHEINPGQECLYESAILTDLLKKLPDFFNGDAFDTKKFTKVLFSTLYTENGRSIFATFSEYGLSMDGIYVDNHGKLIVFHIGTGVIYVNGKKVTRVDDKIYTPFPADNAVRSGNKMEVEEHELSPQEVSEVVLNTDGVGHPHAKEATRVILRK